MRGNGDLYPGKAYCLKWWENGDFNIQGNVCSICIIFFISEFENSTFISMLISYAGAQKTFVTPGGVEGGGGEDSED